MTRLLLMLALAASFLFAQAPGTQLPLDSVKGTPGTAPRMAIIQINGKIIMADIGGGLILETPPTGNPILRAAAVALPNRAVGEVPVAGATPAVFTLANIPKAGTLALYRNGIRQKPVLDYNLAGKVITFIPYYDSDLSPTIVADYEY